MFLGSPGSVELVVVLSLGLLGLLAPAVVGIKWIRALMDASEEYRQGVSRSAGSRPTEDRAPRSAESDWPRLLHVYLALVALIAAVLVLGAVLSGSMPLSVRTVSMMVIPSFMFAVVALFTFAVGRIA